MIMIILGALLVIIVFYLLSNKISIDFRSFLSRTLALDRGKFGVYCFTGKQGSGKTYSLVKYIKKHHSDADTIYSNVTIDGIDYVRLESVDQLLSLKDKKHCFIIYDEIFTLMSKQTRITDELMEFLTQQRKMKNIFFTTAQEWLEIPITFRRFVRIQVDCTTYALGRFGGLLVETYADGYQIKWDQMANEYVAPVISKKISKYEKKYMVAYDTFERIRRLNGRADAAPAVARRSARSAS